MKENATDLDEDTLIRCYDHHTFDKDKVILSYKADGRDAKTMEINVENITGIALVALSQEETLDIFKQSPNPPPQEFYPQEQIAD